MVKKLTSILLLVVFSYSFVGTGFVYHVWLYQIKQEVEESLEIKLSEEETVVIKVPVTWEKDPPENFKWHEEHEFRYQGQMYDIIRKEYHGDEVWFYSYRDRAETELLNDLQEYISVYLMQGEPDGDKNETALKLFLTKIYLLPHYLTSPELVPGPEKIFFTIKPYLTICMDIDPPPPKLMFST